MHKFDVVIQQIVELSLAPRTLIDELPLCAMHLSELRQVRL
jgi:hypothetical protein